MVLTRRRLTTATATTPYKPLDEATLTELFGEYRLVVTVEEHSRVGGAGAAVAEWLAGRARVGARLLVAPGTPFATISEDDSELRCSLRRALPSGSITSSVISLRVKSISRLTCAVTLPAPTIGLTSAITRLR